MIEDRGVTPIETYFDRFKNLDEKGVKELKYKELLQFIQLYLLKSQRKFIKYDGEPVYNIVCNDLERRKDLIRKDMENGIEVKESDYDNY